MCKLKEKRDMQQHSDNLVQHLTLIDVKSHLQRRLARRQQCALVL